MSAVTDAPEEGDLVRVRGQQWVVAYIDRNGQPTDELAAFGLDVTVLDAARTGGMKEGGHEQL